MDGTLSTVPYGIARYFESAAGIWPIVICECCGMGVEPSGALWKDGWMWCIQCERWIAIHATNQTQAHLN